METSDTIRTMRSVREFDTRAVPAEIATRILDAGRLRGSSKNTQPWQFILIKNRETLHALSTYGDYAQHLRGANFAVALVTQATRRAEYDAGRCSQNMMLAAWAEGVGSCIAAMHREEDAKRVLGLPDEYIIQYVISFGYPRHAPRPPRRGGRKRLEELVHYEKW